jgi:hypothetical protein
MNTYRRRGDEEQNFTKYSGILQKGRGPESS